MIELLSKAILIAAKAHKDQKDKGGEIYILHPLSVMDSVAPDVDAMTVAVLHDVIEDTDITKEDLEEIFPPRIVDAVVFLSREPAGTPNRPTYREHIERLSYNALATKVKIADLKHNMSPDRVAGLADHEKSIVRRYEKALRYLNERRRGYVD